MPIGKWILVSQDIIGVMSIWLDNSRKFILTAFEPSFDKTYNYLNNSCLSNNRILFLIYDDSNKLIGNIGLAEVNKNSFELNSLIRGEKGGDSRLGEMAEISFMNFAFNHNSIKSMRARVLSYNLKIL